MIYTASLNVPAKKALSTQVMQSTVNRIAQNMPLDPETTNMDVVILGPKDFVGTRAHILTEAIDKAHPAICIIYLYNKDAEDDLIETPYMKKCKKGKESIAIREAIEEFVGQHKILSGGKQVSSADFETPETDSIPDLGNRVATDNFYKEEPESTWQPQMLYNPLNKEQDAADVTEAVEEPEVPETAEGAVLSHPPCLPEYSDCLPYGLQSIVPEVLPLQRDLPLQSLSPTS
jgi:hypothetical protein